MMVYLLTLAAVLLSTIRAVDAGQGDWPDERRITTNCIKALPSKKRNGSDILYKGFTYGQLTQKWWDFNFPIFYANTVPKQPVKGIFLLKGNQCSSNKFDVVVPFGDMILGALANVADIAFPTDGPQYWDKYDPLLEYMDIDPSVVEAEEKAVFGTTMTELGELDTKLSLVVDGCPLEATATFVKSGLWTPAVLPDIIPADSIGHAAGFYFLLPALKKGRHKIEVTVDQKLAHVVPTFGLNCTFSSTYNVCVGRTSDC